MISIGLELGRSTQNSLPKLGFEGVEDAAYVARKLREKWDDRFVLGEGSLHEGYRSGKLDIRFLFRVIGVDDCQYQAVFYANRGARQDMRADLNVPFLDVVGIQLYTHILCAGCPEDSLRDDDQPMLIGVIQFMQHPKGIFLRGDSSLKRLEAVNSGPRASGNALYHGSRSGFVTVPRLEDGECAFVGRGFSVLLDQLPDQVIQGRTLLIEGFSKNDADLWRRGLTISKNEGQFARLGIVLSRYSIGVIIPECLNGLVEFVDMLVGPFDL